jgi:uncharacterized repeat protein (TIGR02543 family)
MLVCVMIATTMIGVPIMGTAHEEPLPTLSGGEILDFGAYEDHVDVSVGTAESEALSLLPSTIPATVESAPLASELTLDTDDELTFDTDDETTLDTDDETLLPVESVVEPVIQTGLIPVTWELADSTQPYDGDTPGDYGYHAVLTEGFVLSETAVSENYLELPTATITIKESLLENIINLFSSEDDIVITPLASAGWTDNTTDFTYDASVGTWADLEEALNGVGAYDANKPYIININTSTITLDKRYTITNKNIELRRDGVESVDIIPIAQSGTVDAARHFSITGNTSKLVLQNGIVLDGQNTTTGYVGNYQYRGGIYSEASHFYFSGEIKRCRAQNGGAIDLNISPVELVLTDAWIHDNSSAQNGAPDGSGGAISGYAWPGGGSNAAMTITVGGNSIIENNLTNGYGGAIAARDNANNNITVKDNAIIRGNRGANGGGIFLWRGQINLQDNAEISGNKADYNKSKGGAQAYPGQGGGIYVLGANTSSVTMSGTAKILNNDAIRSGGGIGIGVNTSSTVNLHLNGGTISGNRALGTAREMASSNEYDQQTLGSGGGILTSKRTLINIPAGSTVTFSNNYASFVAATNTTDLKTGNLTGFIGDNYTSHIQKDFGQNTSTGFAAPFDNIYNNYDIGVYNDAANGLYSELTLLTDPVSGGSITQSNEQLAGYVDVFGDGRFWKELNQGTKLNFTAVPAEGHVFDGWAYSSDPALTAAEWTAAFGKAPATAAADAAITNFTMPKVHTTLTAKFPSVADINKPADLEFDQTYQVGYIPPPAQAVELTNTGNFGATAVNISLSDYKKDGTPIGESPFEIGGTKITTVAKWGGTNNTWTIQPKSGLDQGAYVATLTLSYYNGAETVTKTSVVGFALAGADPLIVSITSDFDFGTLATGYLQPAAEPVRIQNYGANTAHLSGLAIDGSGASAFTLSGWTGSGNVDGYTMDSTSWSIQPKAGQANGEYFATITATYDGGKTASKDIYLRVQSPAVLVVDSNLSFTSLEEGYALPPNYQPIVIANSGGMVADIKSITSSEGLSSAYSVQMGPSGVPANVGGTDGINNSWMIAPKAFLVAGTYTETFTVNYADGTGINKNAIFTATFTVDPKVGAVRNLAATVNVSEEVATLTWEEPASSTPASYDLQISYDGGNIWQTPGTVANTTFTKDFVIPEFVGVTALAFRVTPVGGPASDVTYYKVAFEAVKSGQGDAPGISATSGTSGAFIKKGAAVSITAAGAGAEAYTYSWSGTGTSGQTTSTLTINSLTSAVNAVCTVTGYTLPGAPTNLTANINASGGTAALSWTAPGTVGGGTTSYEVQASYNGGQYWQSAVSVPSGTSYTFNSESIKTATAISFRVRAVDSFAGAGPVAETIYYKVSFGVNNAGDASGSTISATSGGALANGSFVKTGSDVVITATGAGAGAGAYYVYRWSGAGTSAQTTSILTLNNVTSNINATCQVTGYQSRTVTFNGNNHTNGTVPGSVSNSTFFPGYSVTLPGNTGSLERTGYTYNGWNANSAGTGTHYNTGATFAMTGATQELFAEWTVKPVAATFYNNYSSSDNTTFAAAGTQNALLKYDGKLVVGTSVPTRAGYNFGGWNTFRAGGGTQYLLDTTPATTDNGVANASTASPTLTLYAQWTAKSVGVTFYNNMSGTDDTTFATAATQNASLLYDGKLATETSSPTKTGYSFAQWSTARTGGTVYVLNSTLANSDNGVAGASGLTPTLALYAQYTADTVGVTYHVNGGIGASAPTTPNSATYDSPYTAAAMPVGLMKTGYDFVGWNTNSGGTGTDYPAASSKTWQETGATVLYAKWTPKSISVTYNVNSGTGASAPSGTTATYDVDFSAAAKPGLLDKTGYDFDGWYTTSTGTGGKAYPAGTATPWTEESSPTELFAKWTPKTVTVGYNLNGNTDGTAVTPTTPNSATYDVSYTAAAEPANLAKTGYTFSGWNTLAGGTGTDYPAGTAKTWKEASNATLYVKWTALGGIVVNYSGNGNTAGNPPPSDTATYDATYVAQAKPNDLAKTGYTFTGWNTASGGAGTAFTPSSGKTWQFATTQTLYAQWTPITNIAVTYAGNGNTTGDLPSSTTATYDADFSAAAKPLNLVKTGYTFTEWNTQSGGGGTSFPAGTPIPWTFDTGQTLYAQWTPLTNITVTYSGNTSTGGTLPGNGSATYDADFMAADKGNLAKNGYNFVEWNTQAGGGGTDFPLSTNVTWLFDTGQTLHAQWTVKNNFTVNYALDGGNYSGSGSVANKVGNVSWTQSGLIPADSSASTLTKTGYTFAGWNVTTGGNKAGVLVGDAYSALVTGGADTVTSITLTAQWTVKSSYSVNYALDGGQYKGASSIDPKSAVAWTASALIPSDSSTTTLTKTGYDFAGWKLTHNGNAAVIGGATVGDTTAFSTLAYSDTISTITVTAQWTAQSGIGVTYAANYPGGGTSGGTVPAPTTATYDVDFYASNQNTLSMSSHYFVKWNTQADGNGTDFGVGSPVNWEFTTAQTLYAQWSPNPYDVYYDGNGRTSGSSTVPATHVDGATYGLGYNAAAKPNDLLKTGYTFTMWNTEANGSGTNFVPGTPTNWTFDTTKVLYAQWSENSTYTVTYNLASGAYSGAGSVANKTGNVSWTDTGLVPADSGSATIKKTGFVFTGWNVTTGGSKTNVTATDAYSGLATNDSVTSITLTAQYRAAFTPVRGTHYTITQLSSEGGWTNSNFVVSANSGYLVSTTNTETGDPWASELTYSAETSSGTVNFFVKRIGAAANEGDSGAQIVQGEISLVKAENYKIDKTSPTAEIQYKTNGFKTILNVITFGQFFKANVNVSFGGVDTGGTANSGVAKTEYYKTTDNLSLDEANAVYSSGSILWTEGTGFSVTSAQKGKYHIFVRVTDTAGNSAVYFDSAVIYVDSGQSGQSGNFTKASTGTVTVSASLNGNTVKEIHNTTDSNALLNSPADFTVDTSADTITLTNSYLSSLAASVTPYTFTVTFNPQSVAYTAGTDNEEPDTMTFTVTVSKGTQDNLFFTNLGTAYTYGDAALSELATTGGSGVGHISYSLTPAAGTPASVTLNNPYTGKGTLTFLSPGSFTVTATKANDPDYDEKSLTSATVTVSKAKPAVSLVPSGGATYGQNVQLAVTVAKVGGGAVPAGTVDIYVDGILVSAGLALTSGAATYNAGALSGGAHNFEVQYNGNAYYKGYGSIATADKDPDERATASLTVGLSTDSITVQTVAAKTWGDSDFGLALSAAGSGTGGVTWSSNNTSVISVSDSTAHIEGTGSATITATKAADANYNGTSATVTITVGKATPVWTTSASAAGITYGQRLSASTLSGGTVNGVGIYAANELSGTVSWTDGTDIIPDVTAVIGAEASKYSATFTPGDSHYWSITKDIAVNVGKATPYRNTALSAANIEIFDQLADATLTGGIVQFLYGGIATTVSPNTTTSSGKFANGWAWDVPTTDYNITGLKENIPVTFTPDDTSRFNGFASTASVLVFSPLTRVTTPPTAGTIHYGDSVASSTLNTDSAVAIAVGEENPAPGGKPLAGAWAWSDGSVRATVVGSLTAEVTFTPTNVATPPYLAGSGYATAAEDISITVAKATPTFVSALASQIKNGEALSLSTITSGVVEGAFGETISGTFEWVNPSVIPSDSLGGTGGIGTYNALATFTPDSGQAYGGIGTFEDFYEPLIGSLSVTIPVDVLVDKTALKELEDLIEIKLGEDGSNIHEQNYIAKDIKTLKEAIAKAKAVLKDGAATQVDVNNALEALQKAYDALLHNHPVLAHSHPNGVTSLGQAVSIEIKGHIEDVTALSLGDTEYSFGSVGKGGKRAILQGTTVVGQLTNGSAIVTFNVATIDALANDNYPLVVTFVDNRGTGNSIDSAVANSEIVINRSAANNENENDEDVDDEEDNNANSGSDGRDNVNTDDDRNIGDEADNNTNSGSDTHNNVNTGDDMNLMFWFALAILALIALLILRRKLFKR